MHPSLRHPPLPPRPLPRRSTSRSAPTARRAEASTPPLGRTHRGTWATQPRNAARAPHKIAQWRSKSRAAPLCQRVRGWPVRWPHQRHSRT
eukprot:scaffold24440_cov113-Isochrysis_galbana.AAC.5